MIHTVTGYSVSRLVELEKFKPTNVFNDKYHANGSYNNNGVDYINSIDGDIIIYYIDGIKYVDDIINNKTIYSFERDDDLSNNPDFIDLPYVKNPNKSNIISNPKINNDVFIDRQNISILDKNYRLEYINNLSELTTYISGRYFNIVNNT